VSPEPLSFERFESTVSRQVGFQLDRTMRNRLERSVREAARRAGLTLEEYAEVLVRDAAARQSLVDQVVVPTTSFFRHPEQFDALQRLLPGWTDPVTIWCAACSTGQEAYSLAMLLQESGRQDARVVASDVSGVALRLAASGVYAGSALSGLSRQRRQQYLDKVDKGSCVAPWLRERVTFIPHNLIGEAVPRAALPSVAVFCRNVLIYLRPEVQGALIRRLVSQLPALDALFLGATESLLGVDDQLIPHAMLGTYVYRRIRHPPRAAPAARSRAVPAAVPELAVEPAAWLAKGRALLSDGDALGAAAAFRRACYLDPGDPVAHLNLALALEAAGQGGAQRAYAVALAALELRGSATLEGVLEGLSAAEVVRHINDRLRHTR
jgi:chemotaxis protein methyltransferase CheR